MSRPRAATSVATSNGCALPEGGARFAALSSVTMDRRMGALIRELVLSMPAMRHLTKTSVRPLTALRSKIAFHDRPRILALRDELA